MSAIAAWTVEFTKANVDGKRNFYGNGECFVLAASIRAALDRVEVEYPGCTFIAVHKRSRTLPILVAADCDPPVDYVPTPYLVEPS